VLEKLNNREKFHNWAETALNLHLCLNTYSSPSASQMFSPYNFHASISRGTQESDALPQIELLTLYSPSAEGL